MTLEKLLIFGFALSVSVALTSVANLMADERIVQGGSWKQRVGDLVQRTERGQ